MSTPKWVAVALLTALASLVACREQIAEKATDAVAFLGDRAIKATEVDARILALPAAERPKPGEDLDAWYQAQIRQLAVDLLLRDEATSYGLRQDQAFKGARQEIEKQLAVQLCFSALRPDVEALTEADLRAAYEAKAESLKIPERRSTFHIFLRRSAETDGKKLRARAEALRDRVLRGESFQRVAAAESDSESRHKDGEIAWVSPGQLPAGFEKVIFALEEGVPSEPVETHDGVQLFYVDQILPARQPSVEDIRAVLREKLVAERQQKALEEVEAGIAPEPGSLILDRKSFTELAAQSDPEVVVFRSGDKEIKLSDLRRQLRQNAARPQAAERMNLPPVLQAWQLLEVLRRREQLYEHCEKTGKIPAAELAQQMRQWDEKALLSMQRQRRLLELAKSDEARLRFYYESNGDRFTKPIEWHLKRLRLPLGDKSAANIARLEGAARKQDQSLETLQQELGGEIDDLGSRNLAELRQMEPKLPPLLAPLQVGQLSAPYRAPKYLEIVQLEARTEPEKLDFEKVKDQAAALYLEQYTRELYQELESQLLAGDKLRILPEALAALREAGLPQPDVSPEQLEKLLEEL